VLLSLSAVWCHWCHVMDETSYSDPSNIAFINQHFIPVRVDNDVRPDINARYNMGGWPTTAVLTPQGEVLTGGTYFPPDALAQVLNQALTYFRQHEAELRDRSLTPPRLDPDPVPVPPAAEGVSEILAAISQQYDRAYGGIGAQPKFPMPEIWECLLARYAFWGETWAGGMAVRTLDVMAGGALYDTVEGGFFRYSTTREWSVPHFEKMLDDNARLLTLYLHAFQATGDESYRQLAKHLADWMERRLLQPTGLFAGSQDADEEYYRLGAEDRAKRAAPAVDPTAYAGPNALAVSALLLASTLVDPLYRALALTALEGVFDTLWTPEGIRHDDREGSVVNWLGDLVAVGHAALDAYELTGDPAHLKRARLVVDTMDRTLTDAHPGYFDSPWRPDGVGRLAARQKPLNENVEAARLIRRLGRLDQNAAMVERSAGWLGAFLPVARRLGAYAAGWALGATAFALPLLEFKLAVPHPEEGLDLRQAVYTLYYPERLLRVIGPDDPERDELGLDRDAPATLYVCQGTRCGAPVRRAEDVGPALKAFLTPPTGA
jgi:uncharacterized protein YyaL (SSP411 family)